MWGRSNGFERKMLLSLTNLGICIGLKSQSMEALGACNYAMNNSCEKIPSKTVFLLPD